MKNRGSLGNPTENNLLLKENLMNIIVWVIVLIIEITRCAMGIWGKASALMFFRVYLEKLSEGSTGILVLY